MGGGVVGIFEGSGVGQDDVYGLEEEGSGGVGGLMFYGKDR